MKRTFGFFAVCVVFLVPLLTSCEKYQLDRQMEELCKKDGGVKIYETVKLPPEMFDESGYPFPGWRDRLHKEDRLSKDYLYVEETTVLKDGDPFAYEGKGRLSKWHIQIIRRSDQKVLGEATGYSRTGGDFWSPHPSSNHCPTNGNGPIEKLVFIK